MNEAANDSAQVSGQDRKKLPALGTNPIAGFGGFHPLASLEKKGNICLQIEFLCFFFPWYTYYFSGGLGLGVAFIWIIANTL